MNNGDCLWVNVATGYKDVDVNYAHYAKSHVAVPALQALKALHGYTLSSFPGPAQRLLLAMCGAKIKAHIWTPHIAQQALNACPWLPLLESRATPLISKVENASSWLLV